MAHSTSPARRILAFDIGGTHFRRAVFQNGQIQGPPIKQATPRADSRAHVVPADLVQTLAQAAKEDSFDAIGIAFAGPITPAGVVVRAPNVFGAEVANFELASALSQATGRRVAVVNDMTAAALRQRSAIGDTPTSFLIVTVSSGVGSKIDRGGQIIAGENGMFGEIGHMPINPLSPIRCGCGLRGHLEALASGNAAEKIANELISTNQTQSRFNNSPLVTSWGGEKITNHALVEAAQRGDTFAHYVLKLVADPLAQGILSTYVTSAFERVYVVGGFALAAGDPYFNALRTAIKSMGIFGVEPSQLDSFLATFIERGVDDDNSGLIGAAIAAERTLDGKAIY